VIEIVAVISARACLQDPFAVEALVLKAVQ